MSTQVPTCRALCTVAQGGVTSLPISIRFNVVIGQFGWVSCKPPPSLSLGPTAWCFNFRQNPLGENLALMEQPSQTCLEEIEIKTQQQGVCSKLLPWFDLQGVCFKLLPWFDLRGVCSKLLPWFDRQGVCSKLLPWFDLQGVCSKLLAPLIWSSRSLF